MGGRCLRVWVSRPSARSLPSWSAACSCCVATAVIALVAARRPDRLTILLCLTLLALAFCTVPTRVHERYAYPVFALAILLAAISWRWRIAYAALTATVFLNMYAVLTNPFYNNPGINDWLGIGDGLRSFEGVAIISVINGLVFVWALTELRAGARQRLAWELDDEIDRAEIEDGLVEDGLEPPPLVPESAPRPNAGAVAMAGAGATTVPPTPRPGPGRARSGPPRSPGRCLSPCRHGRPARRSPNSASSAGSGRALAIRPSARTGRPCCGWRAAAASTGSTCGS